MDSFDDLRHFVQSIESPDDAKAKLIPIVTKISKINELFLEISENRNSISTKTNSISSEVRDLLNKIDGLVSLCENESDEISAIQEKQKRILDINSVSLSTPFDEFMKETNLTEGEREQMDETTLIKKQMEFEVSKFNEMKEHYIKEVARSSELKQKLYSASRLYAPIMAKLRELDEVIANFKKANLL